MFLLSLRTPFSPPGCRQNCGVVAVGRDIMGRYICQTNILTLVLERSTLIHHLEVVLLILVLFHKLCVTNSCNQNVLNLRQCWWEKFYLFLNLVFVWTMDI